MTNGWNLLPTRSHDERTEECVAVDESSLRLVTGWCHKPTEAINYTYCRSTRAFGSSYVHVFSLRGATYEQFDKLQRPIHKHAFVGTHPGHVLRSFFTFDACDINLDDWRQAQLSQRMGIGLYFCRMQSAVGRLDNRRTVSLTLCLKINK